MNILKIIITVINKFFIICFLFFLSVDTFSQCSMCKAVVESVGENSQISEGINYGIIYLVVIPYILLGVVGFVIYKQYKK